MNDAEKLSYVKALMYVALADDRVEERELHYLEQVATMYGLEDNQAEMLKESVMKRSESIGDILSNIGERSTKLMLLYDLLALCYADNQYSLLEKRGMREICDTMGIERRKLEDLETVMADQLAIQERINTILER